MSSYITKLEFLPKPYMIFRLGQLLHICCLFCIKFCQALLTLMRGLSCSKIKITYTPPTNALLLHQGQAQKHVIPLRSTQKCSTPTLGVNTKNYYLGFPPNKCSKFLLLSLKSSIAEKGMGYAKVIQKEEENKRKK